MKPPKTTIKTHYRVTGGVDLKYVRQVICEAYSLPYDAKIELFVPVPSGGDYSGVRLNDFELEFDATWESK